MPDTQPLQRFLENNFYAQELLDNGRFYNSLQALRKRSDAAFDWLKGNFEPERMENWSEGNLEANFLLPFYKELGYATMAQDGLSYQGKQHKLDAVIFANKEDLQKYEELGANAIYQFPPPIIAEHKRYSVEIDNKKIQGNPHHQLMNYLNTYRVKWGFLTNGRFWRFYDVTIPTSNKIFYQIDLAELLGKTSPKNEQNTILFTEEKPFTEEQSREYFLYFYGVFSAAARFEKLRAVERDVDGKKQKLQITLQEDLDFQSQQARETTRKKLADSIYDKENSIVERVGLAMHKLYPEESLENLFNQSVILALRLLFIAYFEQKYWNLLKQHEHYTKYSLQEIAENLVLEEQEDRKGYVDVKELFRYLEKGNEDRKIPLFNGGLFAKDKAPLLDDAKLLSQIDLRTILSTLYGYDKEDHKDKLPRSLVHLSIQDLGEIYESLLEHRFRVENFDVVYLKYREDGKNINGYFDNGNASQIRARAQTSAEDAAKLVKKTGQKLKPRELKCSISEFKEIPKGQLFLANSSMERKTTASYYTPLILSKPLVDAALKEIFDDEKSKKRDLLHIKVLDNACGSGHFLVDFLDGFTRRILENMERYPDLSEELADEVGQIKAQVKLYIDDYEVDELLVLKRLLMKKVIFGVDMNPLAVELTCLSLWLDTFIFGTPLSFIEHHIKCGNALMGSRLEEIPKILEQETLFTDTINNTVSLLQTAYQKLDHINDVNSGQVEESKQIFEQAKKDTGSLRHLLDLVSCRQWQQGLVRDKLSDSFLPQPPKERNGASTKKGFSAFATGFEEVRGDLETWLQAPNEYQIDFAALEAVAQKFQFFHYELEFPEAFAPEGSQGFDIVIGNPPWDKVKLAEDDFFPQYVSNYRSLSKDRKKEFIARSMLNVETKQAFEEAQLTAKRFAAYYKNNFPLNAGSGDTNLFRLFIEQNLGLLTQGASLLYLTPSAWSYELGSEALRQKILTEYRIGFFDQFENRNGLFPSIHRSYKFAIFQILKTEPGEVIPCHFMLQRPEQLQNTSIQYPVKLIQELDSEHWSLLEVRDQEALDIAAKLYAKGCALKSEYLNFHNELHMTMDSDLFHEGIKPGYDEGYIPLYQGKHIHQFDQVFARPFEYHLNKEDLERRLKAKEIKRMAKLLGGSAGLKKLGLENQEGLEAFHAFNYQKPRLAFRDIARNTDEHTLIMALLPP